MDTRLLNEKARKLSKELMGKTGEWVMLDGSGAHSLDGNFSVEDLESILTAARKIEELRTQR